MILGMSALDALKAIAPEIHPEIERHLDNAVEDYLQHLMAPADDRTSPQQALAWRLLAEVWTDVFSKRSGRRGPLSAKAAIADLRRAPAIFSGPHLQLAVEPSTFGTLALAHLAASQVGLRHCWVLFCAAVRLETERYGGPGWLKLNGLTHNVFGCSRTVLRRYALPTLPGPLGLTLKPSIGCEPAPVAQWVAERFQGRRFASAPDAFHAVNDDLWRRLFARPDAIPVLLDEAFGAKLIGRHLEEPSSFVTSLLTNRGLLDLFVSQRRAFDEAPASPYNRFSTDLFWFHGPKLLRRACIEEGRLVDPDDPDVHPIAMTRVDLARALQAGRITPSLFLLYLTIGFLPGIRLIGGIRQILYMRTFSTMFHVLWNRAADLGEIDPGSTAPTVRHGWGTSLVPDTENRIDELLSQAVVTGGAFSMYAATLKGRTLRDASQGLSALLTHPASTKAIQQIPRAELT